MVPSKFIIFPVNALKNDHCTIPTKKALLVDIVSGLNSPKQATADN